MTRRREARTPPRRRARFRGLVAALPVLALLSQSACVGLVESTEEAVRRNPKGTAGAAGGAVLGGVIGGLAGGKKYAVIGAISGALLGGAIGGQLDERDRRLAAEAAARALESQPSGYAATWSNPDSGHSGSVTPLRTWRDASGRYCREFVHTVRIAGQEQEAFGTACRQPDGTWEVVDRAGGGAP